MDIHVHQPLFSFFGEGVPGSPLQNGSRIPIPGRALGQLKPNAALHTVLKDLDQLHLGCRRNAKKWAAQPMRPGFPCRHRTPRNWDESSD